MASEPDIERGPCEECGESITLIADECNHCGHNPGKKQYYGPVALIMLGSLLSILIITAVIGVPLFIAGLIWAIVVWRRDDPSPIQDDWLDAQAG